MQGIGNASEIQGHGEAPLLGRSCYFCPDYSAQLQKAWQPGRNTRRQRGSQLLESQLPAIRTCSCNGVQFWAKSSVFNLARTKLDVERNTKTS
jgi:hypothetical protein